MLPRAGAVQRIPLSRAARIQTRTVLSELAQQYAVCNTGMDRPVGP